MRSLLHLFVHLFIFPILILIFFSGCSKRVLSGREISLFGNPKLFAERVNAYGWNFNNRIIQKQNISGIAVHDDVIGNVDFIQTRVGESRFEKVVFSGCSFQSSEFHHNVVKNCIFKKCSTDVLFGGRNQFNQNNFENCRFVECDFLKHHFYENSFTASRFTKCRFKDSGLLKGTVDSMEFDGCTIFNGGLMDVSPAKTIRFVNCTIETFVVSGTVESVEVRDSQIYQFHLGGTIGSMAVVDCQKNNTLKHFGLDMLGVSFARCGSITINNSVKLALQVQRSEVDTMDIRNTRLFLYFWNSKLVTGGRISTLAVEVSAFSESHINNLACENVAFEGKHYLHKTKFENLKLVNTTYGSGNPEKYLFHDQGGVTYVKSDKFPAVRVSLKK